MVIANYKKAKAACDDVGKEVATLVAAQEVLRISAELMHKEVRSKIENIVTEGLRRVFGKKERFFFEIEVKRGRMTAVPMLEKVINGETRTGEIKRGHGGGVADITAFILNIVFLLLTPKTPRVFIADEPFKFVDREYLPQVAEMLKWLNEVTKIQFVIVTHQLELARAADKVFRVTQGKDGVSKVEEE